jgi:hypothetical protein
VCWAALEYVPAFCSCNHSFCKKIAEAEDVVSVNGKQKLFLCALVLVVSETDWHVGSFLQPAKNSLLMAGAFVDIGIHAMWLQWACSALCTLAENEWHQQHTETAEKEKQAHAHMLCNVACCEHQIQHTGKASRLYWGIAITDMERHATMHEQAGMTCQSEGLGAS